MESLGTLRERAIPEIASLKTGSPKLYTWPHQRILIANFRGLDRRDLLLESRSNRSHHRPARVLWTYRYRLEMKSVFLQNSLQLAIWMAMAETKFTAATFSSLTKAKSTGPWK